jgi:hypothetical protein
VLALGGIQVAQQAGNVPTPLHVSIDENYYAWHYWLPLLINALAVLSSGLAVALLWRQTRGTEEAIKAAFISAEAAKKSADALVAADRAWVMFKPTFKMKGSLLGFLHPTPVRKGFVDIEIENVGKTPAFLGELSFQAGLFVTKTNLFDESPNYEAPQVFEKSLLGSGVPGGQRAEVSANGNESNCLQKLADGTLILFVYGRIKYQDAYSQVRETR